MWALGADRKLLLDVFGLEPAKATRKAVSVTFDELEEYRGEELLLLWDREPVQTAVPHAIVVRPGAARDFLSWATTYLSGFRPFTAYVRVFTFEEAQRALMRPEPSLGN